MNNNKTIIVIKHVIRETDTVHNSNIIASRFWHKYYNYNHRLRRCMKHTYLCNCRTKARFYKQYKALTGQGSYIYPCPYSGCIDKCINKLISDK